MKILETQNLILKPYEEKYSQQAHENFLSQEETARYMLWRVTNSVEEAKEKLKKWSKNWKFFWLIHKKETGEPIGFLCVDELKENIYGNIGICLGIEYKGNGYGLQALKACIEFLKILGATEIHYSHFEDNVASRKLAKKLGFQFVKKRPGIRAWDKKQFEEYCYILKTAT